ncbi:hypothetical protein IID21_04370 [Patescibacteria group bacterium]|nr:hypothetical protein [Patescibacteria group bacterium]
MFQLNELFTAPSGKYLFLLLLIWSAFWKGISLWKSAREKQRNWFIVLFISSTAGILPIIYLLFFQKGKRASKKK